MKNEIIKARAQKFDHLKLKPEQLEKDLFSQGVFQAEHAKKMGLIDDIANMDKVCD